MSGISCSGRPYGLIQFGGAYGREPGAFSLNVYEDQKARAVVVVRMLAMEMGTDEAADWLSGVVADLRRAE